MSGYLRRWSQRQRDLSRGVDAGLVRDNRKRYKVAFGLVALGLLLAMLGSKVHTPSLVHWMLVVAGGVSVVVGFLMGMWAQQESAFLSKPDPEEPPTIFKQ
jgi:protein-S-isoprenylcysteine O-methyltransferase Ste14